MRLLPALSAFPLTLGRRKVDLLRRLRPGMKGLATASTLLAFHGRTLVEGNLPKSAQLSSSTDKTAVAGTRAANAPAPDNLIYWVSFLSTGQVNLGER